MKPLSAGLHLKHQHWLIMEADVSSKAPEEACGILAGVENRIETVFPITNILHDPYHFRMDPREQLNAFVLCEENGWDVLAIYHSHPQGIDHPSVTDYDELTFPGTVYLIWYQKSGKWVCRGYLMSVTVEAVEVPLLVSAD